MNITRQTFTSFWEKTLPAFAENTGRGGKTALFAVAFLVANLVGVAAYGQITQVGAATSNTSTGSQNVTITKPAGIQVGDIMIANLVQHDASGGNDISNDVTSAGWTEIAAAEFSSTNDPEYRGTLLYKIAVVADVSATNYTFSSTGNNVTGMIGAIVAFRGVDATTPFDVGPGAALTTGNADDLDAASITTVTADAAVIMLGMVGDDRTMDTWNTATSPGALAELYDLQSTAGDDFAIGAAWAIKSTAGATGAGSAELINTENDFFAAKLIALRPGTTQTQTFISNGTFTVPSGVTSITVQLWGGGGRGGVRTAASGTNGGGGGGGGESAQSVLAVTPGQVYDVFVGAGSNSTSPGGNSRFRLQPAGPDLVRAVGGNSVADNTNTGGAGGSGGIGTTLFNGGMGANGTSGVGSGGGGGSSAGTGAVGNFTAPITQQAGATAPAGGGNGGNGANFNTASTAGATPGGGGGGGYYTTFNGIEQPPGNGADGQVLIIWEIPNCPSITAVLSGDATICEGGSTNLIATITGGATPYDIVYSGGSVNDYTSGDNIPVSPGATTAYTLTTVTDNDGCTATVSGTATVTVVADPVAPTLDVATPANGTTVCEGQDLSATFNPGTGGTGCTDEYQFSINGGSTYNPYTPGNAISTAGLAGQTVIIQGRRNCSGNGCDGAAETFATLASWTVVANPTAFNITGGGAYCAGGAGVAVGLSGSESGVNYQLKIGGVDTGSPVAGTGAAISFGNQTAAGTYTVVATNATTFCTSTMTGSVVVTVNPLPTAGTCNVVSDLCQTNDGSLDISASGGTPPYNVTWTPTDGMSQPQVITNSGDIITITGLIGGTVYTFIVKDANNCQAP